jgi:hypothetical protein
MRLLKAVCFGLACCPLLWGQDLENQSINSGGGWTSNYENSSFTIMGETFQSAHVDLRKPNHFAELNSTAPLVITENQPIGTAVGEFNAIEPDANLKNSFSHSFVLNSTGGGRKLLFHDLNKDGWQDWIDGSGRIYLGGEDGFGEEIKLSNSGVPAVGDFDGDGFLDVFIGVWNSVNKIFYGDSENSFSRSISISEYPGGQGENRVTGAAAIDINQDGRLDIFLTNLHGVPGRGLINNGEGNFTNFWDSTTPSFQRYLEIEDFNNDGLPDLVDSHVAGVNFLKSDGGFLVTEGISHAGNGMIWQPSGGPLAVGDLNGDGLQDVVVLMGLDGGETDKTGAFVLHNSDGTGKFDFINSLGRGEYVFKAVDIGDFDNDGDGDIALLKNNGSELLLYENLGDGNFSLFEHSFEFTNGSDVEFVDFDNDGDLDLALSGSQKVWENESAIRVTYHLVSGIGDGNNSLFTLDQNGTLKTASVFDYEAGETLTIRVQARDESNASVEESFTVRLHDINENLIVPVLTQIQAIDEGIGFNLLTKTQSFFSSFDQISVQGGSDGSIIEAIEAAHNLVDTVNTIGLLIEKLQNNESFQETATALGSKNEQWDEDMISALRIGMNQFLSTLAKEVNRIANPSDDPLSYIFGFDAIIGEPVQGTNMLMAEEFNLFGVEGNGTLQLFRDEVNMTLPTAESDTFTLVSVFPVYPEELPSQGLVRGTDELNIFLDEANPEETYEFAALASNMKYVSFQFDRNFVGEDQVPGTSDDGRFILLGYEEIPLRIYQGDLVFIIGDNFSFEVELKDKDNLARIFNLDKDFNLSNIRKSLVPELTLFEVQDFSNFTHFDVTFNFPINWNRLESYKLGSVVMYENKLWESTIEDNIHNNPTVSDSVFWTELGSNYSETREDWKILSTGTEARLYYTAPDGRLFHDQWDAMDHTIGILNNSTRNYLNTGDIYNDAEELVKKVAYPVTRFEAEAVLAEGIVYFDASSQTYRLATLADGDEKVESAFLKGSIIKNLDIDELQRGDVVQYNDSYFLTLHMLTWDEINSDAGSQIINDVDVVGDLNSTLAEGEKIFEEATGRIFMLLGKSLPTEGREMIMQAGIEQPLNKGAYIYDPVTESFYVAQNNIDDANFVDLDSGNSPLVKINSFLAVQGAEWSVDKKYLKGQIVFHNGVFYECQSNGKPNIKGEYIGFDNSAEEEGFANGVTVTPSDHFISSAEDAISEESLNLMQSRGDKIYNNVWLPVSKLVDHVLGFEISNPLDVTVKIESAGTDGIDADIRVVTDINGLLSSLRIINPGRYFFPGATDADGLTSIPDAFQFAQIVLPNGNSLEANIIWGENPNDPGPFVITGISLDESAGGIDLGLSRANAEEDFSFTLVRSEEIGFQKTGDLSSIQAIANLLHEKSDNLPPVDLNLTDLLLIFENQPIGTIVGEFNATDPDGDQITYHLVSGEGDGNNSLFTLDQNGTLKTAAVLDYEAGSSLNIRVQAKDEMNVTTEGNFTVTLIDVFEDLDGDGIEDHLDDDMDGDGFTNKEELAYPSDPRDPNSIPNQSPFDLNTTEMLMVLENQPIGTLVGNFNAIDPDGEEIVFSLISGMGDNDNSLFNLDPNGTLTTAIVLDFEESSSRSIRVQVNDPHGASISKVFVVAVEDEDEEVGKNPPVNLRTLTPLSIAENRQAGIVVGSFTASDPDGDELIFSLVEGEGGIDNPNFELSKSGVLTTLQTFNFEEQEVQNIRVAVSDQQGGEISKSFEVSILDQNDMPVELGSSGDLTVQENQPVGTIVGQFSATDEDGDDLSFSFARGPGDSGNSNFSLSLDGILSTAKEFDFEESANQLIRISASDGNGGTVSESFVVKIIDQFENRAPQELNSTGVLSVAENSKIGTLVARFKAVDPEGDDLTFSLVSGEGDSDNGLFVIDENGTLTTGAVFDFEEAAIRSIRVGVADPHGESISQKFTVRIIDHQNEAIMLEVAEFQCDGEAGEIGRLKVLGREDLSFGLGQDQIGAMHFFVIEDDGTLLLAEDAIHSASYNLTALIFENGQPLDQQPVTVHVTVAEPEDFMDADTSDPAYHEAALMIRDLTVVQDDWRNGHNPITKIEDKMDGLFVSTAQPHGRKVGDSVVLSGVQGLQIDGIQNWNFMIDEVNSTSFRLRRFGRDEDGLYDGSPGEVVRAVDGTSYQPSLSDFLLGPWTFGHLLGNMVSEEDDPVEFYKHFASQWNHVQTVNGWSSDRRKSTHEELVPNVELTLANIPFRLLAIGNRIDLFHAKSMRKVNDAGEGRFVFTMTQEFDLPEEELSIWKVHQKTFDQGLFTLIFEYGQPAGDFATLAKWAKDWHSLQREKIGSGFDFNDQYFHRLNELTDRFSKRGSHPSKPNGNPINQVRTNDFIGFTVWQMREFNLASKAKAHEVKAHPDRKTILMADGTIDIGLWTTTTKNNPMVQDNGVDESIAKPLARWINQRESHILSADVGPRAPEWMEGPVANEPGGFSYTFDTEKVRTNLARYKYSLSTCSGCHTGDTGAGFQMVVSSGKDQPAHFAPFMVGNGSGGMHIVADRENPRGERYEFFDLKAREEIARDILSVAQQVDAARLRLTRTEIKLDGAEAPSHVFVSGGIIGDWQYDLPSGREDNDFYILNSSTGELSIRGNGQVPPFGKGRIFIRARATDGTGVVIERPYSVWILTSDESRQMEDLDPSIQPSDLPPLATPRPNRTH